MSSVWSRYVAGFDWTKILDEVFSKSVSLLLLFLIFFLAKKVSHVAVLKVLNSSFRFSNQDKARQKTITRLVESLLNYILYFLLIYWILSILGLPVSSLLAGAGIAGVAIGMGAQGFLSDLVNGFFILVERQLDVGDQVSLSNGSITIKGKVVSVGIRTTQVRGNDGTLHYVPNRNITVVSNLSRGDMRVQIDLPLPSDLDLTKLEEVLNAVNEREVPRHPAIQGQVDLVGPQTDEKGQFSYRIQFQVLNGEQMLLYHEFYHLYQEALLKAGIPLQHVNRKGI